MQKELYLAGPISGFDLDDANEWRHQVARAMRNTYIECLSPMRAKTATHAIDKIDDSDLAAVHTTAAINVRDYNDVKRADALLVNLLNAKQISIGTVMEIAWAREQQKPVILVMEEGDQNPHYHGMLTWGIIWVHTLRQGIAMAKTVLGSGI